MDKLTVGPHPWVRLSTHRLRTMASRPFFPDSAVSWLVGDEPSRVLVLGASGPYATAIRDAGHGVLVLDRSADGLSRLVERRPDLGGVVAQGESLPLASGTFDRIVCPQNLHTFAPGLALTEFARVLAPHGRLCVIYLTRDDSVPWVKRLTAVVRNRLPDAMTGDYGDASLDALRTSAYFPDLEEHSHRLWVPSTRQQLVDMARRATGAERLSAEDLDALGDEVGGVYDSSARPPEPLLLPYRLGCWRAMVDHSEFSSPIQPLDDALHIRLGAPPA